MMEYLKQQGMTSNCVVLWGNSIESAVAIQMANEYPVGALILQSLFPSLGALGQYHMPFLPVRLFLKDKYDNLAKITQFKAPTLVLQGEEDTIAPPKFSRQLFEALKGPKELHSIPGRGHNNLFEPSIIDAFLQKWARQ